MTADVNSLVASSGSSTARGARSIERTRRRGRSLFAWTLFAPAVLWVSLVMIVPIFYVVWISFFDQSYLHRGKFVGLDNYRTALTGPGAVDSFLATLVFTVASLALALIVSIVLAVIVNDLRHGARTVFTVIFVLPWITSTVVTALLWQWLVTPGVGLLSVTFGDILGDQHLDLLGNSVTSMATLVCVSVWKIYPFGFVLVLAALRSVPRDVIEAAKVDGAGPFKTFLHVSLPGLRNTLLVVTVVFAIHLESSAEVPLALTGGGPADATNIVGLRIYREAFQTLHLGVASALAVVLFVVNAVLGFFYVRSVRSEDF